MTYDPALQAVADQDAAQLRDELDRIEHAALKMFGADGWRMYLAGMASMAEHWQRVAVTDNQQLTDAQFRTGIAVRATLWTDVLRRACDRYDLHLAEED